MVPQSQITLLSLQMLILFQRIKKKVIIIYYRGSGVEVVSMFKLVGVEDIQCQWWVEIFKFKEIVVMG